MENGIYAKFNTSKGAILVKLAHDLTPGTVGNFVALAEGNLENKVKLLTNLQFTEQFYMAASKHVSNVNRLKIHTALVTLQNNGELKKMFKKYRE